MVSSIAPVIASPNIGRTSTYSIGQDGMFMLHCTLLTSKFPILSSKLNTNNSIMTLYNHDFVTNTE